MGERKRKKLREIGREFLLFLSQKFLRKHIYSLYIYSNPCFSYHSVKGTIL